MEKNLKKCVCIYVYGKKVEKNPAWVWPVHWNGSCSHKFLRLFPGRGSTLRGRARRSVTPYIVGSLKFLDNDFILSIMLAAAT